MFVKQFKIRSFEYGLLFRDGEFQGLLHEGRHWLFDPLGKVRVEVVSQRAPWLVHEKLDMIVKSGVLAKRAVVLDLKDYERALVWVDGRFSHVLPPGLFAYWTTHREVRIEVVDARQTRFQHEHLQLIVRGQLSDRVIESFAVEHGQVGLLFQDGNYIETLPPGRYAFWKNMAKFAVQAVDLRETMQDIAGQEIMTADKVTLRLNAVVVFRVVDAWKSVRVTDNVRQTIYREAQLALRAAIGARELDALLADKDGVAKELAEFVRGRMTEFGVEIVSLGIRDVILPGEMKDLLNKVTEAKKSAEANLIVRREETAAMRSQANTAKLLEGNPALLRLRELEALEKIAGGGQLKVILGEKGLTERVMNLL